MTTPTEITTLEQLEGVLGAGRLYCHMANNRWWQARRNGRTQRWKRDPNRFRLPIKVGFRGYYAALTQKDLPLNPEYFRVRNEENES